MKTTHQGLLRHNGVYTLCKGLVKHAKVRMAWKTVNCKKCIKRKNWWEKR